MAPEVLTVPAAPRHLPADAAKKWQATYAKALAQAKIDNPENESAQRAVAAKAANAMLAVPAPTSAAEIDALGDWQVIKRETRTTKDGAQIRVCVTADGRKYSFPIFAPAAVSVDLNKMTKDQLVQHAADNHDLALDPASTKADMIAAIGEAAKK